MKEVLKAFITFNRTERIGIAIICFILLALIVTRATMHFWVQSPTLNDQQKIITAWNNFKNNHGHEEAATYAVTSQSTNYKNDTQILKPAVQAHLFSFDPNILDSAGFRKLGLKAKTTTILLHWRAKGKVFYHKEDLKGVYTLQADEYARLEPYIIIKNDAAKGYTKNNNIGVVNLNKADSATLIQLKGIGPYTAHKIITYRAEHGAFINYDELKQLRNFNDDEFAELKKHLVIK